MPRFLPQRKFTVGPDSRKQVQQSFQEKANELDSNGKSLPVGTNNVATEEDLVGKSIFYVKTTKKLEQHNPKVNDALVQPARVKVSRASQSQQNQASAAPAKKRKRQPLRSKDFSDGNQYIRALIERATEEKEEKELFPKIKSLEAEDIPRTLWQEAENLSQESEDFQRADNQAHFSREQDYQNQEQYVEALVEPAKESNEPFLPAVKSFEAEDIPRALDAKKTKKIVDLSSKSDPSLQNADKEVRLALDEVVSEASDQKQQILLNQLELAASIIARAFCSQHFPLVIPADNFNYLQSKGFENFTTVKTLRRTNTGEKLAKRFAANGGGAIAAISFLLQDMDTNSGNIGFSCEKRKERKAQNQEDQSKTQNHPVALDTGMYFAPLHYTIVTRDISILQSPVWDLNQKMGMVERDSMVTDFGLQAIQISLQDAFHISDHVLCQLPRPSIDSSAVRKINKSRESSSADVSDLRKGYRPINGFDLCFDPREPESNVQKHLQANRKCRKDLLLQFLVSIIVFESGFIEIALSQYNFDRLLKQQILSITAQRIGELKKVLFNQNNKVHRELRSLVTAEDLDKALKDHVECYNFETEHPNFQLNLKTCQKRAAVLVTEAALMRSSERALDDDYRPAEKSPEISDSLLRKMIYYHYAHFNSNQDKKNILVQVSNLSLRHDQLLELLAVLRKANQIIGCGIDHGEECYQLLEELFDKSGNFSENVYYRLRRLNDAEGIKQEINRYFYDLLSQPLIKLRPLKSYLEKLKHDHSIDSYNRRNSLHQLEVLKQFLIFVTRNIRKFVNLTQDELSHLEKIYKIYDKFSSEITQLDRCALDIILTQLIEKKIQFHNFHPIINWFHDVISRNPAIKRFNDDRFEPMRHILTVAIISVYTGQTKLLYPLNDRLTLIASEQDAGILKLMTRIIAKEMQYRSPLRKEQFEFFYNKIKLLKKDFPEKFALLKNKDGIEFFTEVFLAVDFDINDSWRLNILSSALHWYSQASPFLEDDKKKFVEAVKEVSENTVKLQKFCGEDDPVILTQTFIGSTLFRLKYRAELNKIEESCKKNSEESPQKPPLKLHENLIRLNQKSREFAFDGKHAASKEAYQYCETTIKLFSKNNRNSDLEAIKIEKYPQLNKHRGFGAFISDIARSVAILLTGWNAGLVSKAWRATLFGENTFQPYKTKSTKLVTNISHVTETLLKPR